MTTKEIALAVGKTERSVRRWIEKAADNMSVRTNENEEKKMGYTDKIKRYGKRWFVADITKTLFFIAAITMTIVFYGLKCLVLIALVYFGMSFEIAQVMYEDKKDAEARSENSH